jgi:hypothetical protein
MIVFFPAKTATASTKPNVKDRLYHHTRRLPIAEIAILQLKLCGSPSPIRDDDPQFFIELY